MLTDEELESKLAEMQDKLFKQKIQKSLGQADNLFKMKSTKKDIARIKTIMYEKRLNNGNDGNKEKES